MSGTLQFKRFKFCDAVDGPRIANAVEAWNAKKYQVNGAMVNWYYDVLCSFYEESPIPTHSTVLLSIGAEVGHRRVKDDEVEVPIEVLRNRGVPFPDHLLWALLHRPPFGMERMFQQIIAEDFDSFVDEARHLEQTLWNDGIGNSMKDNRNGRNQWMYAAAKHAIHAAWHLRRKYCVGKNLSCFCIGVAGCQWVSCATNHGRFHCP